jgi:hypothetical protein
MAVDDLEAVLKNRVKVDVVGDAECGGCADLDRLGRGAIGKGTDMIFIE